MNKPNFKYEVGDIVRLNSSIWTGGFAGCVGTITAQLEHMPTSAEYIMYEEYEVIIDGEFLYAHEGDLEAVVA